MHASVIITDPSFSFEQMKQTFAAIQDEHFCEEIAKKNYLVMESLDDFERLFSVLSSKQFKNSDKCDRGYLLGSVEKHLGSRVWNKISKEKFRDSFIQIPTAKPIRDISEQWVNQTLAIMIDRTCNEDESIELQMLLMAQMEKINSGENLDTQHEEEEQKIEAGRNNDMEVHVRQVPHAESDSNI